jgi:hypothetical protein
MVQVAQADLGSRVRIVLRVDDVFNDDVVGGYGYADDQGGLVVEFIVFDGILHEGLHRDRGDEVVFGREVGDLDDHADGVAEAYFEQVEIVADEFYFFPQEHHVFFLIAQDIPVYLGQGIIIETGVLRISCDEEGEGVQGVKDEMGIYLVLQGFQFCLCFGYIQLFDPGLAVFHFLIKEQDLVDVGNEAGGNDDD